MSKISGLCLLFLAPAFAQYVTPQRDSVVVTGTYEPLALEEIDRAIRVLPVRPNNLVLNTLVDSLKLDPSLDLGERAPNGVQTDLSIRGATYGQTLVLLNGQRLNDVQSGHHSMDIPVPLETVTRAEVLRGSGSTMYGSDAIGGVINVITAPPDNTEVRLRTALGNDGINQQRASLGIHGRKLSELASFSRDFSSGFMPGRDYRNLQFASVTSLVTTYGTGTLNLAYMDRPFGANQFYGNYNSWEDTKTWFAGIQQPLGEKTTVSFGFRRHSDLFVLLRNQPEFYNNHHSDESYQFAARRRQEFGPAATLYYGLEGFHESIASTNLGDHSRWRGAGYVAFDWRAVKRYSITVSAREEIYRNFSGAFTPAIAGGAWTSRTTKLRASASRAFRIPTYTELYYHDPANQGNPSLRPESAWTYEAGVDWIPSPRTRGDLTIFDRRVRDGIDYYRASPTDIWRALNIQNLNFTGVETSLRLRPRPRQTLDLRYTGLRARQDTVPFGQTKYTFNYPRHSGVVQWQADLPCRVMVRTRLGVLDRLGQSPYALWDVFAASSRSRLRPFLQLANVTGAAYQEIPGVVMPGRTVIGGLEFVWQGR